MKIKINDEHILEIKNIYEEFTLIELTDLIERLNNAFPSEKTSGHKEIVLPLKKKNSKIIKAGGVSRETAIEMLKDYYYNHNKTKVSKEKANYLRKHLNLKPQEYGLKAVPKGRWGDITPYLLNSNEMPVKPVKQQKKVIKKVRKHPNKYSKLNPNPLFDTREKAVALLKLVYFGTKEEKHKIASDNNQEWDNISKAIHGLKKRYNIVPQDIGLNKFPVRGEVGVGRRKEAINNQEQKKDELLEEVQYY